MKRWNVLPKNEPLLDDTSTTNPNQPDPLLTLKEVAAELRLSKAQVSRIIAGKVRGVAPLPAIRLGTRLLVRRSAFEKCKIENESVAASCYSQRARNSRDERMGENKRA
jgi:predicted DNA-binding transcriptional regulator AlpA